MGVGSGAGNFFSQLNSKKISLTVIVIIISFLFTPGLILNLPPSGPPKNEKTEKIVGAFNTNIYSMIVHSLVIGLVFYLLITPFGQKWFLNKLFGINYQIL